MRGFDYHNKNRRMTYGKTDPESLLHGAPLAVMLADAGAPAVPAPSPLAVMLPPPLA